MSYESLPKDLKNMIADFGWNIAAKQLHNNLQTCTEINSWKLHIVFQKQKVYCRRSRMYVPNPVQIFRPISWFGNSWRVLFDWCVVDEFLHRLDFRKRVVRSTGSRRKWRSRISNWRNLLLLDTFFKILLRLPQDPFKPTYKAERFNGLKWVWD